ncbi:MAG: ABC transporter permease [Verrucomicrobiales bacterium]|nr:ABC transporter permease [Verrucomicrobiales bacterium]
MRWTFELIESAKIAWAAIRANRLRSILTTLGIIVGIVTVTLMGMAIEGLNNAFKLSIANLGADTLYVGRIPWKRITAADWMQLMKRRPIDLAQSRELERRMTNALALAPMTETRLTVQYAGRSASGVTIIGTSEPFQLTSGITMAQGRFLQPQEADGGRPVCVVGSLVASNLFVNENPLGTRIRIAGESVEVIGVMDKRGSFLGQFSLDNQIVIPTRLFLKAFGWDPEFSIQIKARNVGDLESLAEEVRGLLRIIRRVGPSEEDDFAINQQSGILESFGRVTAIIGSVGLFISGLSLFVGGIGIMNIMFVSVAERTREIGIRKAIGAKRRSILIQFLTEAASICLMAGLLGIGIAWCISLVLSHYLPVTMSLRIAGLAVGVSLAVGVISGFLPAWRAARLKPVDALRNE